MSTLQLVFAMYAGWIVLILIPVCVSQLRDEQRRLTAWRKSHIVSESVETNERQAA